MCAQGQALHLLGGLTVDELRKTSQSDADKKVAKMFGISLAHSALLRIVNDHREGAPSSVIRNPEQVLGDQAQVVLAFWRHLDRMTPAAKRAVLAAAWEEARVAAGEVAMDAAREAAGEAAMDAAREAAGEAGRWRGREAAGASSEIQGAAFMRANNQPFFFLPLFGFPDPEAVLDAAAI